MKLFQNKNGTHKGHMLHLIVCCGLPILILMALPLFGYSGFLQRIVPFICPVMMLLMIPMMMRGHGGGCHDRSDQRETKSLEQLEQKEQ